MRWVGWHVRQMYALRKWKPERADLHEPCVGPRRLMDVDRQLRALARLGPRSFALSQERISSPAMRYELFYSLRAARGRKPVTR